jgi:hypothetical protein
MGAGQYAAASCDSFMTLSVFDLPSLIGSKATRRP